MAGSASEVRTKAAVPLYVFIELSRAAATIAILHMKLESMLFFRWTWIQTLVRLRRATFGDCEPPLHLVEVSLKSKFTS